MHLGVVYRRYPAPHPTATTAALPPGIVFFQNASVARPWQCYRPAHGREYSGDVEVVDGKLVCRAHSTADGRRVGCREYEELLMVRAKTLIRQ